MVLYRILIVLMFLVLLLGAVWLLHRREGTHQKELALLREENAHLREIIRLMRAPEAPVTGTVPESNPFLDTVRSLIEGGLANGDYNVEAIAAKMSMSTQTFRRRLRAATSLSPKEYILGIQIEKAAGMLLRENDMPVQEVGRRCGFFDASSFGHSFRRYYNCSPSHYRGAAGSVFGRK